MVKQLKHKMSCPEISLQKSKHNSGLCELYRPDKIYHSLQKNTSVQTLMDEIETSDEILNILCWDTFAEPAILVNHCMAQCRMDVLQKIRFISHWTNSSFRVGSVEN